MTDVLLFHHVLGRTEGMEALAGRLRAAGHVVHLPDLFDGRRFATVEEGSAYAQQVGVGTLLERARVVVADLPRALVLAGVSLGVMPAQLLAQTRLGALGAVLVSGAVEPSEFDAPWPAGVPLQVHGMADDPFLAEGDLDAARSLVETAGAELFLYPGSAHLFTEAGSPDFDAVATDLLLERVTGLLGRVG